MSRINTFNKREKAIAKVEFFCEGKGTGPSCLLPFSYGQFRWQQFFFNSSPSLFPLNEVLDFANYLRGLRITILPCEPAFRYPLIESKEQLVALAFGDTVIAGNPGAEAKGVNSYRRGRCKIPICQRRQAMTTSMLTRITIR